MGGGGGEGEEGQRGKEREGGERVDENGNGFLSSTLAGGVVHFWAVIALRMFF